MSSISNKPNLPPATYPTAPATPAATPQASPGENPQLQAQLQAQLERARGGGGGRIGGNDGSVRQQEKLAEQTLVPSQRGRSADEIERLAGQVGYVRPQKKKRHGFEMDDMSQAPIPLPADDIDDKNAFDQKSLDDAQEGLTLQSNELKQLAHDVEQNALPQLGFVSRLVERAFNPTPEGIAKLEALKDATAQQEPEVAMGTVNGSLDDLFGLNLKQVAQGPALVSVALVVAGKSHAVKPMGDSVEPKSFCRGMEEVVSSSNEAVDDARTMKSGINRQLAMQQTFVFRK